MDIALSLIGTHGHLMGISWYPDGHIVACFKSRCLLFRLTFVLGVELVVVYSVNQRYFAVLYILSTLFTSHLSKQKRKEKKKYIRNYAPLPCPSFSSMQQWCNRGRKKTRGVRWEIAVHTLYQTKLKCHPSQTLHVQQNEAAPVFPMVGSLLSLSLALLLRIEKRKSQLLKFQEHNYKKM